MIISFFGHSSFKPTTKARNEILGLLDEKIKGQEVTFYLGGYGNFDNFALDCCKQYKQNHQNATLLFVTPYLNEWLDKRRDYFTAEYDEILYPPIEDAPLKFAISRRNDWMVDNSDFVITFVNSRFGGAYNALVRATKKSKDLVNLAKNFNLT